jgi:hypothetical protein
MYFVVPADGKFNLAMLLIVQRGIRNSGGPSGISILSNNASDDQGSIFGFTNKAVRSLLQLL